MLDPPHSTRIPGRRQPAGRRRTPLRPGVTAAPISCGRSPVCFCRSDATPGPARRTLTFGHHRADHRDHDRSVRRRLNRGRRLRVSGGGADDTEPVAGGVFDQDRNEFPGRMGTVPGVGFPDHPGHHRGCDVREPERKRLCHLRNSQSLSIGRHPDDPARPHLPSQSGIGCFLGGTR